jgi:hypothetical protein
MMQDDSLRVELIKHLSAEITSSTEFLHTLRSRMAFNVLLGPFLVPGSFVVAATKTAIFWPKGPWPWVGLSLAVISYFGLGLYGSQIDKHLTRQCDLLRDKLLFVAKNNPIGEMRIDSSEELGWRHKLAYLTGFLIVVLAFIGVATFFLGLVIH